MPTLITSTAQLKTHLGGIQKSLDFNTIEPFIPVAERRFIATAIGKDFHAFLCGTDDAAFATVKALATKAAAWYGYFLALPHLRVVSGDLGTMMNQPSRTTMAPKWAHVDLVSSTSENADAALEDLLEELETCEAPEWTASQGFKTNRTLIVRNAAKLTEHLPLVQNRRRTFMALRFYLKRAEDTIAAEVCTDEVFDALKVKYINAPDTLTALEKKLLYLIGEVISPYALYRAIPGMRLRVDGDGLYVQTIDDAMKNQTPSTYPAIDALSKDLMNTYKEAETALAEWLDANATDTVFPAYYTKKQGRTREIVTLSDSSLGFF
ncbi:DUF6712 family protein [Runella sp.]|uniref:DUF6712 family protein n=1 Tax=Runella sp. TaxID=1960881 RepID=UPI003D151D26